MYQQDLFTPASTTSSSDVWRAAGADSSFSDIELKVLLQAAVFDAHVVNSTDFFDCDSCIKKLDELALAARYCKDSHVIALRDIALEAIKTLGVYKDACADEFKRRSAWSMVRPLSVIHAEIKSPFNRSARVIHGRAYQGQADKLDVE